MIYYETSVNLINRDIIQKKVRYESWLPVIFNWWELEHPLQKDLKTQETEIETSETKKIRIVWNRQPAVRNNT